MKSHNWDEFYNINNINEAINNITKSIRQFTVDWKIIYSVLRVFSLKRNPLL